MMRWTRLLAGAAALTLVVPTLAGDVDAVRKAIRDGYETLKSMKARSTSETRMEADGFSMVSRNEGTYEFVRRDGKYLYRMEMTGQSEQTIGGETTKSSGTSLSVCDGRSVWTLHDEGGQKSCMKMKATDEIDVDPLAHYEDEYNLKVLPEEKAAGLDCYVIEITPKSPASQPGMSRTVMHVTKEYGVTAKMVAYNEAGQPMSTTTVSDIQFNVDLAADRFAFEPPADVEVMDMDALQESMDDDAP